jgi:NAD(P)-dependent dehydrogenase (short-subunit alcohol dehydrogenase family)
MIIEGKTVLITGANRGIGKALVAEALHRGAARVYAAMRRLEPPTDERVVALQLDVTDDDQISRVVDQISDLDLLINNAGVAIYDRLDDVRVTQEHLAVNFFGPYRLTLALLPLLRASHGAIANNLSVLALAPMPLIASYSISKAAFHNMSQSLRMILKADGIAVHNVFLGPVDTDMNRGVDMPKDSPAAAAEGTFDGLELDQEDIFPDMMSKSLAEAWKTGVSKQLEIQNAQFLAGVAH